MPRIRPLRAIPSLGGSPAVGGSWSDDRLADSDAELPRGPVLRVKPLVDGSGWHASVLAGKVEIGRLAYCPRLRGGSRRLKHCTMLRVAPCLPSPTDRPPSGPGWLHEIKHDGFRLLAQRSGGRVRLYTRNGHSLTTRYPLIARAVELLALRSCLIDGEVIVCNGNGRSALSTCSNSTAGTCVRSRSRTASAS